MYRNRRIIALIMAAGSGLRLGSETPKQFLDVDGEPMISKSARVFDDCLYVDDFWTVCSPEYFARTDELLGAFAKYRGHYAGADVRQESVRCGLAGICESRDGAIVLIHDAARPFVTQDVVERVIEGAALTGAAIACVPVTDTIYKANGMAQCKPPLYMEDSPSRDTLWSVQTPQGFDLRMITLAHETAAADGFEATDDGAIAKKYGYVVGRDRAAVNPSTIDHSQKSGNGSGADVLIVMGSYSNRKITTQEDLPAAGGTDDRVGIGFDVHAFTGGSQPVESDMPGENSGGVIHSSFEGDGQGRVLAPGAGRALVLGGVRIPYERALEGHSDADVLTHAIMDAMLGALSLGDIGKHFPDTDESYRGISSMKLLAKVMDLVCAEGYAPYNLDAVIIAERPRMAGYIDGIKDSISSATGIPRGKIGIKATTTEGLGFTGREEGIGAQAIVRLTRTADSIKLDKMKRGKG